MALRKPIADPFDPVSARADWRRGLPELSDGSLRLREVRTADAGSLVAHLNDARVWRYIAPCPSTIGGFVRFIRWARVERRGGRLACFGIIPPGASCAVGVIQVWPIERDFSTAEWGFVLGEGFWGRGLFTASARLALDAVFTHLGVYRLEARAVDLNQRGNRALERLGARRDGVLRGAFHDGQVVRDHVMWSILEPEWRAQRSRTTCVTAVGS